ncbi:hypothetical protein B0T26DRAFT_700738 [Lasiosphaeria miniovina]|uniref:Uncharacterized protein n=1 Tax=Lasiosphaeria miniovina TaxID=1954250 RepID=A0AA40E2M6_9PEZI|nr:uncharacterized protein B0T26DRAFT_700738 [Lasiosphaeria miniovina]KAK0721926.1 hypothetical protein B0T26DRAFT_700738 [Lasiosphaeria miniovina]
MTCIGSAVRLWIFSGDSEFLIPFVPSSGGLGLPKTSEYLEISTHGARFSTAWTTSDSIQRPRESCSARLHRPGRPTQQSPTIGTTTRSLS